MAKALDQGVVTDDDMVRRLLPVTTKLAVQKPSAPTTSDQADEAVQCPAAPRIPPPELSPIALEQGDEDILREVANPLPGRALRTRPSGQRDGDFSVNGCQQTIRESTARSRLTVERSIDQCRIGHRVHVGPRYHVPQDVADPGRRHLGYRHHRGSLCFMHPP